MGRLRRIVPGASSILVSRAESFTVLRKYVFRTHLRLRAGTGSRGRLRLVGRACCNRQFVEDFGQSGGGFSAGAPRGSGSGRFTSHEACRALISIVAWTPNNSFKPSPFRGSSKKPVPLGRAGLIQALGGGRR